ncbi:pyridoxal phosphate-dependent aminotransferase [Rhodovulum sp. DZ06]|uniref:pyridoxal phosphate-dependent aminotransferase n=1 Tax=Rhodovulum sp. DZ06 TaxID=3425126 RepID=UPI003D32BD22
MKISRRSAVEAFRVMDVMEAARRREDAGHDVVHLEVGQPATPAPRRAREAAARLLKDGAPMGYTVALGIPELRERIARRIKEEYGADVPAERVIVTSGSSAGFILSFLALFDVGDSVVIGDPGYPSYRNTLAALGLAPRRVATGPATRWQPVAGDLGDAAGLLAASPANPTGTMLDEAAMKALVDACAASGAAFISDEIYHGLHWNGRSVSALEFSDDAIVINSFSKYFSMTGWRVGWMVVPDKLVRPIERLAQNLFICAPHVSQVAALHALDATEELETYRAVYARNREILLDGLPGAGFGNFAPCDGGFYIYVDVSEQCDDSQDLCRRMLEEAGVAATPGVDFDPDRGAQGLRFSFAGSEADMVEALRRLRNWKR